MARRSGFELEREDFIKSQIISLQKALNKQEMALKQKHARVLIVGTHKEKGATLFWNSASRIQLEKHPIVSWKFCHLLHKLLRDGHSRVLNDSIRYRSRLLELGKFWHHLREGYGRLISIYCKLIANRLAFHQRNPSIPGSLQLTDSQINSLGGGDVNNAFELAIEVLDQMDDLMALQKEVFSAMDMSRANSLTLSGQCRLAPLILVILDSSKFYDYLVKIIFRLHASIPPDVLVGHRDRFNGQFKLIKQFYYTSANMQYFKYLVSIPTLPEHPPNFLEASDFESYVAPHAYLHGDGASEGSETPPDGNSVLDLLVDVTEPPQQAPPPISFDKFEEAFASTPIQNGQNEKDQMIDSLRLDLEDAKAANERLKSEARSRMEQYENRLLQMEHEAAQQKHLLEQISEENDRFREQAEQLQNEKNQQTAVKLQETEKKAQSSEDKFKKMKDVYAKLREEHIEVLKKLGALQKDLEAEKGATMDAQDRLRAVERDLEGMRRDRGLVEERAQNSAQELDELNSQFAKMQMEIEHLTRENEDAKAAAEADRTKLQRAVDEATANAAKLSADLDVANKRISDLFAACCIAAIKITDETLEQFDNPAHLSVTCSPEFMLTRTGPLLETFEKLTQTFEAAQQAGQGANGPLTQCLSTFAHDLAEAILHGKATANAAPTDQTDTLIATCRSAAKSANGFYDKLSKQGEHWTAAKSSLASLKTELERFESQYRGLLGKMGDIDLNELGSQIDIEMKRMDAAIQAAASKIQEIMSKTREKDTGIRLEVNERIMDSCNALMQAIMILVQRSRDLQNEIVAKGRGTGSAHEFYKRNNQWTEGLLSAAKAVGVAANFLVQAADNVIIGKGKFEELIVASQEIAASTAQLFMSSRVKADRGSELFSKLATASKGVNAATAKVVGTVKAGQETLTQDQSLDFSHLTLHKAKQLEMESQVRTLELESLLEQERAKLAALRKQHYHMAGVQEDGGSNGGSKEGTPFS
uniref:Huntingtin interacting protein 1 n=1 Tax=Plectus sambesii TaxID=2011161 RepID=A0A914XKE5_9BILA